MNKHHPSIKTDSSDEPIGPVVHRTNVSADNPNIIIQGPFYRVVDDMRQVPLDDYLEHGYETRMEFREAITNLLNHWHGRVGECVEERCFHGNEGEAIDQRHRQLLLRFHDTPGGCPDEAWLPLYLLKRVPIPDYARWHSLTEEEQMLMEIDSALWND